MLNNWYFKRKNGMKTEDKTKKNIWIDPSPSTPLKGDDALALDGIDHVELYVANARQSSFYFCKAFGFEPIAYRGPETGHRETASYVLKQNQAVLILTTPLRPNHPITFSLINHADSVKVIALTVPDCAAFYHEAMRRGAESVEVPNIWEDNKGIIKRASIKTYGDTIHTLIERKNYQGLFLPGFAAYTKVFQPMQTNPVGLQVIDHMVGNVELGQMDHWVSFYENVLGFKEMLRFTDKDISTEYSALMSKVMRDGSGKVKFPLNEPAQGRRKSQIEEYLEFHCGPGVQHIALRTNDIISTVSALRTHGVMFLKVPQTYYDELPARVGSINEDLKKIAELGILVDRDDDGYLLQLFTKPVHDRPTLFFEIIQREGSQGFGIGNFKALFEAIERDQALRGNL